MGVLTKERKKEGKSSTTVKSMGEGEGTQWSKGAASQRSSNVHGGMDNTQGGGNICGVQGV